MDPTLLQLEMTLKRLQGQLDKLANEVQSLDEKIDDLYYEPELGPGYREAREHFFILQFS